MLNFNRIQAGIYQAAHSGSKLNINREGASYWALRLDGEFVEAYSTLGDAKIAANSLCGTTAPTRTINHAAPSKTLTPAIMHNRRGLYVFGLDEICEVLAGTYQEFSDLNGVCRPHVTQRGKHGYFVDAKAAIAFWDACHEEIPGAIAICMGEGKKWEVRL